MTPPRAKASPPRRTRLPAVAVLFAALALPWLLPPFYVSLLDTVFLAAIVCVGLVLLTGIAGISSFGQAAFAGIAAYAAAGLTIEAAWPPWMTLPVALLLVVAAALLLGLLTVRLSGHFLPLGTIAWGVAAAALFGALPGLGGYNGLPAVPPLPPFAGHDRALACLLGACLLLVLWLARNLLDGRHGRALRALAAGRALAESVGVDSAGLALRVFVLAALAAGLSGWLYAFVQRVVNPTPFNLAAGIEYLFMVILGGAGSLPGAVLGATLVVVLRDELDDWLPRLLGRPGSFEGMAFALAVILALQRLPGGLASLGLPERKASSAAPSEKTDRKRPPDRHQTRPRFGAHRVKVFLLLFLQKKKSLPFLPPRPSPPPGPLLRLDAVTRRFGGLLANDRVGLSLHPGEILALIGPNGAGKSTLFDQISGLAAPESGTIHLCGTSIAGRPARAIARLGLARTFQHVRLLPGRSVLENVALGAHGQGRRGLLAAMLRLDRAEERALLALAAKEAARVGLGDVLYASADTLPLGRQRVVEVARALCLRPRVLLLDEPAAGLRLPEKRALAALLRRLRDEGMAVLLVEHDMDLVMGLADRVVVLDFGRVIAEGPPARVQVDPRVQEAYLGGTDGA